MNPALSEWLTVVGMAATTMFVTISAIWSLAWWLSKQFQNMRHLVYDVSQKSEENLLKKMEYHEKHDDQRFADLTHDIWDIKVINAARDAIAPIIREKITNGKG